MKRKAIFAERRKKRWLVYYSLVKVDNKMKYLAVDINHHDKENHDQHENVC